MVRMLFLALFAGFVALFSAPIADAQTPASTEEIRGLIREFIEKNPDVILQSLSRYDQEQRVASAKAILRPHTPTHGPDNALVTVVEFSEFQCPFCARAQDTLKALRARYGTRVQFAYKHLPLDFHPQAEPAALASIAAHNQGKFWEFSDVIWKNQSKLGERLYTKTAQDLGLNMPQFDLDRKAASTRQALARDLLDARTVGAEGTPFFLINGRPLSGARPINDFVTIIEQALAEAAK